MDHKEFKINQKNIVKHLSNCKFILDNMQIWKNKNFQIELNIKYLEKKLVMNKKNYNYWRGGYIGCHVVEEFLKLVIK